MSTDSQNELTSFMEAYEQANNSHVWSNVDPFIANNATYWFTDGFYSGKGEIREAIQRTFDKIQNENYAISNLKWPVRSKSAAVCTYTFHWEGVVKGSKRSGDGRGTNVLIRNNDIWQIVHEHLSS